MLLIIRLLAFGRPYAAVLLFSLLCRVVNQAGTIAMLVIAGCFADHLLHSGRDALPFEYLVLPLLVIGVIKAVFRYLEQVFGHHTAFSVLKALRDRIYWKLEQQSPGNIGHLSSGDLISRVISDIERVEVFYAHTIVPVLSAVIVSLLLIACDWVWFGGDVAALHLLLLFIAGVLIPWIHYCRLTLDGETVRENFGRMNACLTDIINGTEEIQHWRSMAFFRRRIQEQGEALQAGYARLALHNGMKDGLTDLVIGIGFLGLLLVAWLGYADGQLPLSLLCLYASSFGPVLALTRTFEDLSLTIPCCKRVLALLFDEDTSSEGEKWFSAGDEKSSSCVELLPIPLLDVRNVGFSHNKAVPVIHNGNMRIYAGDYHLLQGESGSGKTTLLRLLAGIWVPEQGEICFNGLPIKEDNREAFWQQITYVPQQSVIFPASLRHNLCLGLEVSDDRIMQVLGMVCLLPALARMEDGLDTLMGLNGVRVSGGEGQRIALARAILRDSPVYFLDEAFSALDRETEHEVRGRIKSFFSHRVVVEISHHPVPSRYLRACQSQVHTWIMDKGELMAGEEQT